MKNVLNYYYNLYPTTIHQINSSYKCYINNEEFLFTLYEKDKKNIDKIYELNNYLQNIGVPCHRIIKNINGQLVTEINNKNYILLKIFIKNRNVNIEDILFLSSIYVENGNFRELVKDNWYNLWTRKIDYFEYQVSQFGKRYPIIRDSINYYIGMAENSISLFLNASKKDANRLVISHQRINNDSGIIEFYNPLNFIIDNRIRDLGEYIKENFFFYKYTLEDAKKDILRFNLTKHEYNLLFIRLLFPSYYFDYYEQVLSENKSENELLKIIAKNDQYIIFLSNLYILFKEFIEVHTVEWIIKT